MKCICVPENFTLALRCLFAVCVSTHFAVCVKDTIFITFIECCAKTRTPSSHGGEQHGRYSQCSLQVRRVVLPAEVGGIGVAAFFTPAWKPLPISHLRESGNRWPVWLNVVVFFGTSSKKEQRVIAAAGVPMLRYSLRPSCCRKCGNRLMYFPARALVCPCACNQCLPYTSTGTRRECLRWKHWGTKSAASARSPHRESPTAKILEGYHDSGIFSHFRSRNPTRTWFSCVELLPSEKNLEESTVGALSVDISHLGQFFLCRGCLTSVITHCDFHPSVHSE